jgi:hypothetical protein
MKNLPLQAVRRLYLFAALLLPLAAILVAVTILNLPTAQQLKFKPAYDILISIAATGVTILVTMFFLDQAETIKLTAELSEALSNPSLPLANTVRRILRDTLANTDQQNGIEIFPDEERAYEALIDDIDDGDVFLLNTIFVTDDHTGKYQPKGENRRKWIDTIKERIHQSAGRGTGSSLTMHIMEAPKGGALRFVEAIGGMDELRRHGGRVYSLNIDSTQSKHMANFVLIKKTSERTKKYIVYLGWFARAPNSREYPSPSARIESEQLYKFLEGSYSQALIAKAEPIEEGTEA